MNKVERLISQICPKGVPRVKIDDLISYEQPTKYLVASKSYDDSYSTPVLTAGQSFLLGYTNEEHGKYPASANSPVIIFDDFTTAYKWVDFEFKVKSSAMKMLTLRAGAPISLRYFWYALSTIQIDTSEHARYWISKISQIAIPLPPLEIQNEIVRILDTFTELEAELEAELKARKTQYSEFLRSTFNFSDRDEVRWREIGEVCSTFSGAFVKKTEQDDDFEYPVFNGGSTATGYYSEFNSPENSIAISARGSIGAVNWVPTKFWAGNSCHVVLATDPELNNRFLYHYLKFHEPSLYALRAVGSIPALNLKPLLKFPVPLPLLETQMKISGVLDKFETLINDISIGLPGEIAARRQQYEYYRDKLLTFRNLEVA